MARLGKVRNANRRRIHPPPGSPGNNHGDFSPVTLRGQQRLMPQRVNCIHDVAKSQPKQPLSGFSRKKLLPRLNPQFRIDGPHAPGQRVNFRDTDVPIQSGELPIHIAYTNLVRVNQRQLPDSRPRQSFHSPRANPAHADDRHVSGAQPFQSRLPIKSANSPKSRFVFAHNFFWFKPPPEPARTKRPKVSANTSKSNFSKMGQPASTDDGIFLPKVHITHRMLRVVAGIFLLAPFLSKAQNVIITDVPDYSWYAGCFGSASGNLMGYWDRNGFPNFYTGPTAGGVAPLDSNGPNVGIRSIWASRAGFDGRPADKPGHTDDYWEFFSDAAYSFESTKPDPYLLAGRAEHEPDCTGDFLGSAQNKWPDLNGECSGNVDGYAFNFWDKQGRRLENFTPPDYEGKPVRDIQSGYRNWARWRGYDANVYSQLADFNPPVPTGAGFTFADLKAEIDAGYPVILVLQIPEMSRSLGDMPRANPRMHAMLAYGYIASESDPNRVRYRTSWATGDHNIGEWREGNWEIGMSLRGVIGFHPLPQITSITQETEGVRIRWDGPSSMLQNLATAETWPAHFYVLEKATSLNPANFIEVTEPSPDRETLIPNCCEGESAFFRIKLR